MELDDMEDRERMYRVRSMARKLAHNRSHHRVVRKLPQTIAVVRSPRKRAIPVRRVINANKRLTYMLLLGVSLCAFVYDADPNDLLSMLRAVEQAANSRLGGILGST